MTSLVDSLQTPPIQTASQAADRIATRRILGADPEPSPADALTFSASAVEIVALRLIHSQDRSASRSAAQEAFELLRAIIQTSGAARPSTLDRSRRLTRAASFGVIADLHAQTRQLLLAFGDQETTEPIAREEEDWESQVEVALLGAWQFLIRKSSWSDIDGVHANIAQIRASQAGQEPEFLAIQSSTRPAWRIISFYHLLRAAEIVAEYTEHGVVGDHFDPVEQADVHFDQARDAASEASDGDLAFTVELLRATASSLVRKSIWRITRGAGTRATEFVRHLASRDRNDPFLELLPPQQKALAEEGLIGTGRRSVVVSLPTSAGKTLVAEFRILQALDSYEAQAGWVAYTAPTRALVNQLTARLRRDLSPLGIRVERFSPALEVDSIEAEILSDEGSPFRVIVTTPEKLDLLLRSGWVADLNRPLSLVIVDEAHNLSGGPRGLKLELLLATINREARDASFLLLTPFIPNAKQIAEWLDASNNQAVELGLEWLPNDRVVGLAKIQKGSARGSSTLLAESVATSAPSLHTNGDIAIGTGRPLGLTYSTLSKPTNLATAAADALSNRGSTVTLVGQPAWSWGAAEKLAQASGSPATDEVTESISSLLRAEYGPSYPLAELIRRGVAVHHAGLSDDARTMVEALAERGSLRHIVATTTLAQGINFPISNVVLATHKYPYGVEMPASDFWNIAGRAGRANHGEPGVILLAAENPQRAAELRTYLTTVAQDLTSTLVTMVADAIKVTGRLDIARLSFLGNWSSFAQFVTHTYRMVGAEDFALRVETVLRGTLGYRELRAKHPAWADELVRAVRAYSSQLSGQPLSLVDSTGFSLESVRATLARMTDAGIGSALIEPELLAPGSRSLSDAIGVLLKVPELHEQLVERLDAGQSDGNFLSRVVKDWVAGKPLFELARDYFSGVNQDQPSQDPTEAITRCCQRLFGAILPTISWGLSALQALELARTPSDVAIPDSVRDIPSYVFYGVNSRQAVALRLFGVPRGAALGLAQEFANIQTTEQLRERLVSSTAEQWRRALGPIGDDYFRAWKLVEPIA